MPLQKFLNLRALMIGTAGVLLVSKAVYTSPKELLQSTSHHGPIGWPSNETLAGIVGPKADVTISIVALVIAFAVQFVSLMLVDEGTPFLESAVRGLLLAVAFTVVGSIILYLAHRGIYTQTLQKVKCLEAGDYLSRGLIKEIGRPTPSGSELKVELDGLEHIIKTYFGIVRSESESSSEFVRRVAARIGTRLPKGLNLDALGDLDNK